MRLWSFSPVFILLLIMPLVISECESKEDRNRDDSSTADGTYIGTALRGETSCFSDGDCFFCTATDEVRLVRKYSDITITTTGSDLTYTPCKTSGTINFILKGKLDSLNDDWRSFQISDCNSGVYPGSGTGLVDGNQITTSFSCDMGGGDKAEWNNVVLTKQ